MNIYQDIGLQGSMNSHLGNLKKTATPKIFPHFYTHQSRLIFPCKRVCQKTKEFCNSYVGLTPLKQSQVDTLIDKIERGEDLKPHQSKLVNSYKVEKLDKLLFDWGIYHLHLHPDRTSELIYCILTCNKAYLIDIKSHKDFEDIELLEVLDKKWDYLLKPLPKNIGTLLDIRDKETINKLRRQNLNGPCVINGKILMEIGGGITHAGTSGLASNNIVYLNHQGSCDNDPYIIPPDNIWVRQNTVSKKKTYNFCVHPSLNLFKDQ